MKKRFLIINLIISTLILLINCLYLNGGKIELKFTMSILFTIMGFLNLGFYYLNKIKIKKSLVLIFLGLVLSMVGDIIIFYDFIYGAVFFVFAHFMYILSYNFIEKYCIKDIKIISFIFIVGLSFINLVPFIKIEETNLRILSILYTFVISIMCGKSISNYMQKRELFRLIIMIGSILFLISDMCLVLDVFAKVGIIAFYLTGILYFPAQILLSISVLLNQF
jgi:uncharacterized membrane protein YhhN